MTTVSTAQKTSPDIVLQLRGITRRFPGVTALEKVSFELKGGEVRGLVGENGAGKSTLIKVIAGIEQPDEGEIVCYGEPVKIATPQDAMKLGIAVIHQELSLYPDLSVAENVFMGRMPKRGALRLLDWRTLYSKTQQIFQSMGVRIDVRRKVGELSLAQRQLVEIARALSQEARILIMDEPTASLAGQEVEHLFDIIRRLITSGVAIVFISHRLEEVLEIADTITVLRNGHYIGMKEAKETSRDELIHMMVGRNIDTLFPKEEVRIGEPVLTCRVLEQGELLKNINLELRRGEIVGLAGLVGAGRTELAETIIGIRPLEKGEVLLDGQCVHIKNPEQALKLGIVYLPEDRKQNGIIAQMNVKENTTLSTLRLLCPFAVTSLRTEKPVTEEFVRKLDIRTPSIHTMAANLSGGNQQKVVLAKMLAAKPKVLILDEPTRGIDVGAKREIHRLISQLAKEGLAILMISSELLEILGMSDRILVMRKGEIVGELSRQEATQERILRLAMLSNDGQNGL